MTTTADTRIAELLEAGYSVDFAAEEGATKGWTRGDILRVASERGWTLDSSGRIPRPLRPAPRPPAQMRPGRVLDETPAHPTPTQQGAAMDGVKEKIAKALKSESGPIQRAAKKANDALATLDTLLAEWESKELARRRVAELERQLAEAKATLRGPADKKPATAAKGEHAQARAWARENGMQVPSIGRVPADVLTAWRQANGSAA